MIHTLTLNPAVDYLVELPSLSEGAVNRCLSEEARWGGKGINVSLVLAALGVPSVIMGVLGGFTGHAVRRGLKTMGLRTDFIELEGRLTRINIKIAVGGSRTEIHGSGPAIDPEAVKELGRKLDRLGEGDLLVLAGQPPSPLEDDFYAGLIERLSSRGAAAVLSAVGGALEAALEKKPALVKTNLASLSELSGRNLQTAPLEASSASGADSPSRERALDLIAAKEAAALQAKGAGEALVSLGPRGALLATGGKVFKASPPKGRPVDAYGAGDSLLAGFLAGQARKLDKMESLRLGAAAATATAFSASLADRPAIEALMSGVEVSEIP